METRHEACSAEGQPRNILECNPNRFAGRCPALSRHGHCVIHSCYAFLAHFNRRDAPCVEKSSPAIALRAPPAPPGTVNVAATRRRLLHRSGTAAGFAGAILHQIKTTARIALPR